VEQRTVADRSGLLREGDASRAERLIEALIRHFQARMPYGLVVPDSN